ncbi:MAG: hypothetical protein NXY57DRAFT_982937 [Lentinula lateritia]|uniref:RING-type domain-containing protein n=1 Tax=Lentinula lateritia TaxID=40482 RepID=A0ABQ8W0U2_9AGAR|nr:MAG: hypothetical protein NXY57DRAFT_982937 [Lentinula lateritia]KAJ4501555.1 hypothetical protein C8R41DRAFT_2825 [Lentinula lateritia]
MSLLPVRPRARSSSARPQSTTFKGKTKSNLASIPPDVTELTDSSDEDCVVAKESSRDVTRSGHTLPRKQSTPKPLGASASAENIPPSSARRESKTNMFPPFLPSDEENVPPSRNSNLPSIIEDFVVVDLVPLKHPEGDHVEENQLMELQAEKNAQLSMLSQVLELVPDVQPEYAEELILQHSTTRQGEVLEAVIHALFENSAYPKIDKKGKRKSTEQHHDEGGHKKPRFDEPDYSRLDREYKGGVHYSDLSIEHLMVDFPDIPKPYIRKTLYANKSLYVPAHLYLREEQQRGPPFTYVPKKTLYKPSSKGKHRALEDAEFDQERAWLLEKLRGDDVKMDGAVAERVNQQEYEECGDGIECGCCFTTFPFDKMIQCPDAHLFCSDCMSSYAENLLGAHNINIVCMDQSECKLLFPVSELRRFLSDKLLELYERVKQRKEIEMAGLEGLEECPFCEYKCVIENPNEKLFRCGNEETCGAITCRQCKKIDHLPKSCKEMEEDKVLDGRHLIEEAMTRALMRNCPHCDKSFVKEDGCNKMTCPHCHTLSCYVCRQRVTGYDHFNQSNPGAPGSSSSKKCPLWEPVESRHAQEVKAAAEKALEDYKRDNPDVSETDIKVDVPKFPGHVQASNAAADPLGYGLPGMPRNNPYAPMAIQPHLQHVNNLLRHRAAVYAAALPPPAPHPPQPPAPVPAVRVQPRGHRHRWR